PPCPALRGGLVFPLADSFPILDPQVGPMSSAAIHVEDKGHTRAWKGAVILVLAGLLVYSNSFNKAYVFDDEVYLPGAKRLKSVGEVFNTWGARKVGGLSFWVTDRLGKGQVGWHHAGNVAIHIIAALALFGVVR